MWTFEQLKAILLKKRGSKETFPFGPEVSVFKVGSKMFALAIEESSSLRVNLKCHPDEAELQRSMFDAIVPGYHMNKKHWNTVILDGTIPEPLIEEMIDVSYGLVVNGLKRSERETLGLEKVNFGPKKS